MPNVQHSVLTDPELHESKGVASATNHQVYVANGAGSGNWDRLPDGAIYFNNIGSPYTLTYPASYTKIAATTTASGLATDVTEATTSRLTYTGAATRNCEVAAVLSVSQSIGANRDLRFCFAKNGTTLTNSAIILTTVSGEKMSAKLYWQLSLATNDYIEVFAQNDGASGDISVYTMQLFMNGHAR